MGPGDPPYIKSNVHFIHFIKPSVSAVNRSSNQTFISAAKSADTKVDNEYVVNMQQYETTSLGAKYDYYRGNMIGRSGVRTQGHTVVDGKNQNGGRSSNSYYVSQNKEGKWSAGLGDPSTKDTKIAFGGGIPLLVDGMSFGAEKKYDSDGKMIQNSSLGFKAQNENSKTLGKTILAFDDDGNFMIVSQQNGVKGMTLAGIRDYLKSEGYTNAISYDGSTSSTLVKDKKVIVSPNERKDNSIPVGAKIN